MSIVVQRPRDQYPRNAFDGVKEKFNLPSARASIWLSQLAYEDDVDKIDSILADWGLIRRAFLAAPAGATPFETATRGIVVAGHGRTFIAFAGTDPLKFADWVTDIQVAPTAGGVHSGFDNAISAVWSDIAQLLAVNGQGTRLWLAGHSLGAAIVRCVRNAPAASRPLILSAPTCSACRAWAGQASSILTSRRLAPRHSVSFTERTSFHRSRRQTSAIGTSGDGCPAPGRGISTRGVCPPQSMIFRNFRRVSFRASAR